MRLSNVVVEEKTDPTQSMIESRLSEDKQHNEKELTEHEQEILLEDVVPGDIVKLVAGDLIPGDVLLLETRDLFVSQAILTGESVPIEKQAPSNRFYNPSPNFNKNPAHSIASDVLPYQTSSILILLQLHHIKMSVHERLSLEYLIVYCFIQK
jgi:P-type E1-E2 ATPase